MNEIRDIHDPFCAWLNKRGIPHHRNRPDKKTTAIKGDPDFMLTQCNHCVYIECKVSGGKLSKDQEKRIAYLRSAGNRVVVAYSLQECIDAAQGIMCQGSDKNAPGAAKLAPLDVERHESMLMRDAAEVVGKYGSTPHDQHLWIAYIGDVRYVFDGDCQPGGNARIVRRATPQDIRDLPRK